MRSPRRDWSPASALRATVTRPTRDILQEHHLDRQVTLIEVEVLETLALATTASSLRPTSIGATLLLAVYRSAILWGNTFVLAIVCSMRGAAERPCLYLENLIAKKVFKPLLNRSGLNSRIVIGGIIRTHEGIEWCDPSSLDVSSVWRTKQLPSNARQKPDRGLVVLFSRGRVRTPYPSRLQSH